MKTVAMAILRYFLEFVYCFIKFFASTKDKITYISRQSDTPGIDFSMLSDMIKEKYPQYDQRMLCRMIPKSKSGMIKYAFHIFTQMWHIASSKVVILDTYCIPISLLHHKKSLVVIQMWHALGAFKKFGLSVAGQAEGTSLDVVKAMRMHKGYDYVLASGDCCVPPFAEAFGTDESKFLPIGLPRMDYLAEDKYVSASRERIYQAYPQLVNGKKTILYVPTFRRSGGVNDYDMEYASNEVKNAVDLSRFNLIIKTHSGSELVMTDSETSENRLFMGMDLIAVSDYIISDYSSIVFEAAIPLKPVYLYCYDRDKYITDRGLYLDYDKDIPAIKARDIADIIDSISRDERPSIADISAFADKYVSRRYGSVTKLLAEIVDELARGVYDGRYNYTGE
ncbi:MAG: CDP-glycerol glycerophosphotransferase family protein [Clostridia bacterium]|nr:CDP-glycerol glycerophosphotransferase family protein [Clostridia bacterium]